MRSPVLHLAALEASAAALWDDAPPLRVLAVFPHALSLVAADARWLTVLHASARGPERAHLGPRTPALDTLGLVPGTPVSLEDTRLNLGRCLLDRTAATEVYDLAPPLPCLDAAACDRAARRLAAALPPRLAGPGERRARALLDQLLATPLTAAAAPPLAAALVGLGEGLTPSGDDLLCGLLAALQHTRSPEGSDLLTTLRTSLPPAVLARSTPQGTRQLELALAARHPAALLRLLPALAAAEATDAADALQELLGFGASSGHCLAQGAVAGLRWVGGAP